MEEKFGIEHTKKLILFGVGFGESITQANADGVINFKDAPIFLKELFKLPGAIKSAKFFKDEIMDLSEAEETELKAWFKATFSCPDEKVEEMVEKAISTAIDGYVFVRSTIDLAAAIKAMKA